MTIHIRVSGKPAPQGSKRAIMRPGQRCPSVVESAGDKLKQWRAAVQLAASKEMEGKEPIAGGVRVQLSFSFLRPKNHYGTGRNASNLKQSAPRIHTQTPDVDKLTRAVLDALTGVVYRDDSQVVMLTVQKNWHRMGSGVEVAVDAIH